MYFGNRKPRGFHHTFMFVDERKELIKRLEAGNDDKAEGGNGTNEIRPAIRHGAFRTGGKFSFVSVTIGFGMVLIAVTVFIATLCVLMNL